MILNFFILAFGLALLWVGAELLIKNSSKFARSLGVSPVIIGLTVVSIGTSLPEFVVSLMAAIQNTMGISIGNIIGSNIANIGLILGIGGLLSQLEVKKSWVKKEVPAMLFFTIVFIIFCRTGYIISRLEGIVLLLFLVTFLGYLSRASLLQMQDFKELQEMKGETVRHLPISKKAVLLLLSTAGIIILIIGSKITVDSGTQIARTLGVSDTVIGLTLIAVGTSLPELATTIVGVMHKETDIVVGNVVGSNIFNLLFIGGMVPLIRPIPIEQSLFSIQFPFLLGISVLLWPLMRIRWRIYRWEGILLLSTYALFLGLTYSV
ncbi:MAG: calcium/sodium antiporter [Calditrichia bacterium]